MNNDTIVRQPTRSAISRLVEKVMETESLPLPEAIMKVYESRLYALINDSETGLYREGPVYLYSMLCEESLKRCTPSLASQEKS